MNVFLPLGGRLKAIKVVFAVIVAVALVATFADLYELVLLQRAMGGADVSEPGADLLSVQGYLGLAQFVLYLAGAIVWTRWLYTAYRNLDAIRPGARRFGLGWAIGAWFVPVLSLWRPKEIVNDVWRAGRTEPSDLLNAWWLVFLATGWLGWIVMYYTLPIVIPGGARADTLAWALANLADAVGATLAILAATALTKQVEAGWEMRTPPLERTPAALQLEGTRG